MNLFAKWRVFAIVPPNLSEISISQISYLLNFRKWWEIKLFIYTQTFSHIESLFKSQIIIWRFDTDLGVRLSGASCFCLFIWSFPKTPWASEIMAQQVKVFAAKLARLSLGLRTHILEGDNSLPQVVFLMSSHTHTHHSTWIPIINKYWVNNVINIKYISNNNTIKPFNPLC